MAPDDLCKMRSSPVVEIVAIDGRNHDVLEAERSYRIRHPHRLIRIERTRTPGRHVAERAGARAHVAHDHHGRVALLPARADVGAARLFADGRKPVRAVTIARVAR